MFGTLLEVVLSFKHVLYVVKYSGICRRNIHETCIGMAAIGGHMVDGGSGCKLIGTHQVGLLPAWEKLDKQAPTYLRGDQVHQVSLTSYFANPRFEVFIDCGAVGTDAEGSIVRVDVVRVGHGEHLVLEGWPRLMTLFKRSVTASTVVRPETAASSC